MGTVRAQRLCARCGEPVLSTMPARINSRGTFHIGGCDTSPAVETLEAAFRLQNEVAPLIAEMMSDG